MIDSSVGLDADGARRVLLQLHDLVVIELRACAAALVGELLAALWPFARQVQGQAADYTVHAELAPPPLRPTSSYVHITTFRPAAGDEEKARLYLGIGDWSRWVSFPTGACGVRGPEIYMWFPNATELANVVRRAVKQILVSAAERRGSLLVHASAALSDGRTHLFAGARGAGKTTLALAATRRDGRFISNDRCILRSDPQLCVSGFPDPLRLVKDPRQPKAVIQLREAFDDHQIGRGWSVVDSLVFPLRTDGPAKAERISPSESQRLLRANLLTPQDEERPQWLGLNEVPEPSAAIALAPGYRLEWSLGEEEAALHALAHASDGAAH